MSGRALSASRVIINSRAVHAQHDRLDAAVLACITDLLDQRLRAQNRAIQRIERALARGDRAYGIDEGDAGTRAEPDRRRRNPQVVTALDAVHHVLTKRRLAVAELVFVREVVHEADPERLVRHERPLIEECAHFLLGLLPPLGNAAHQLLVDIPVERLGHLAMSGRESFFCELVCRGLVITDVEDVRIGASLVERATQEHLVRGHTTEIERAARQEVDLVGGAGQVVLTVTAVFEERDDSLARLAEVGHRVSELLHLRPVRQLQTGRHEQHGLDAGIAPRLVEVVDEPAHRIDFPAEHLADEVVGNDFLELAAGPQHECRCGRYRRRARDREIHERDSRDRHEHGETDEREHETDAAA
jgi:hypothetical protein